MKKRKILKGKKIKSKKKYSKLKRVNRNELVIYIFNVVEDEWSFVSAIQPLEKRYEAINELNNASECYLFANASNQEFIYISPIKISNSFKKYFQSVCNTKKVDILVPTRKTGLVCKDLYTDKFLFNDFIKKAKKYKKVTLISYATSPEFYELKERLLQLRINVSTPEAPEIENAWTVNFFGSKSGIRQLAQQSRAVEPDFIMPDGVICVGKLDAAKIAANRYINEKGVVLKTNKGSGGHGVLIFRDGELPRDYKSCEKRIYELLSEDGYWDRFPIIIEQLINVNFNNISSFPNIEFKIHKSGKIEMLYYCLMMVTGEGKYYGLDMNEEILNERTAARIIDTGYYIAEQYEDAGYRGHFDIDMISSGNSKMYVCESNTRNTGGTDVYKLTRELYGKDFFSDAYVINRDNYTLKTQKPIEFDSILKKVQPVLFDKSRKEGVILSGSGYLSANSLLYTIYGNSKKRAYKIQSDLLEILNSID
ncbi:hypothetical protein A2767_02550 [Candidatus Roizmanbacteria bacterium RIFCSPHIGHO2_01_FULL_35_10]|uniref:ATP-grasp domain-containing protein n=1 Tax=Candidatus Roizmanbacteria bacterium RIFCSPLOWO2_01_FULL_35_13 TaxID=1802055 RepID=A0A1F7IAX8_9BACT|nr:MAG: hypothetical protein A2767_02550 [Candidatus Roizmanbacteria bacterium RIFCSPHIGHO2_01_FULL_35_10]OGK40509.1 MAG: hypothetical protein A3A74_02870 [Candidatus Roizmanbacteria bacterium RIFCSPLOWO2_01_FULL_35_13]